MAIETTTTPLDKDVIHKELDLIQDVIKRMAANSFQVKAWLIGILTGLIAFKNEQMFGGTIATLTLGKGGVLGLNLLLLLPIFTFWYLDAFFLRTERLYIQIYNWVVKNRTTTSEYLYDLNPRRFDEKVDSIRQIMMSKTLFPFYVLPLIFVIGLLIFNALNNQTVTSFVPTVQYPK
jgi:hypothetical protein